jgi:ParB family chromosome partitioning protein
VDKEKKARLGRGLDVLFASGEGQPNGSDPGTRVNVDTIDQNPFQPRKTFDQDEITTLSETIREYGILQPLVVRQVGDRFQLIAGERRLRAAREAGLDAVPVTVVNFNDQQVIEAALVENIQRTDLNPIEKALGFKDYQTRFQLTHDQIATRLGLARSSITNLIALLDLSPEVQEAVRVGQITLGHAKLLKGVDSHENQTALCRQIVARALSVHATEGLIKEVLHEKPSDTPAREREPAPTKTAHVQGIEDDLRQRLSTRVEIKLKAKDRGQIVVTFESNDDFERVIEALRR